MKNRGQYSGVPLDCNIDYSAPELADALEQLPGIVMDIRREANRRADLYEKSLGLLVVPVLLRRMLLRLVYRLKNPRS